MQPKFIRLAAADAAATLTRITAKTIAHAIHRLPIKPRLVLVAGGGRRNPCMMRHLASCLTMPLKTERNDAYDADMLEAELMAFLAARHHFGLPTSFPGTTGCKKPICGGQLALAK